MDTHYYSVLSSCSFRYLISRLNEENVHRNHKRVYTNITCNVVKGEGTGVKFP